jgi:hypothetical protein
LKGKFEIIYYCEVHPLSLELSENAIQKTAGENSSWLARFKQKFFLRQGQAGLPDFSLKHDNQTGKNVPNEYKRYQMVIKYPKCPENIPNGHKIYIPTFFHPRLSKIFPIGIIWF